MYYLSNSFWCSLIILLIEEDIRKIKCFTHTNLKIITLMSLNLNVASSVIQYYKEVGLTRYIQNVRLSKSNMVHTYHGQYIQPGHTCILQNSYKT